MRDRSLIIRFEQLTHVPGWIWHRTDLEFLCLSDNCLTAIPETIGRLTNLRANALTSLPEQLANLPNLQKLDLRWTNLTDLAATSSCLAALEARGSIVLR